jgi:hypothetical protein
VNFKVVGGKLLDVIGAGKVDGRFMFVPVRVELSGTSFSPESELRDHPKAKTAADDDLQELLENRIDAIWARSRIEALFAVPSASEDERVEKSLMGFGFLAVENSSLDSQPIAYAFECTDYYGRSNLFFSEAEIDPDLRSSIGDAFWDLLLSNPDKLADYEDRSFHSGAGIWMIFGRRDGCFFMEETEDV